MFEGCKLFSSPEGKAHLGAYRIGRPPSSIVCRLSVRRLCVHRPHSLNNSSETTGAIEAKFYMKSTWDGGTKVCSNSPGLMTKMAAMLIYGKSLKNILLLNQRPMTWNLVCSIGCSSATKCVQMMTLGLTWAISWQGQILVTGKKGKTMDFSETIVVYDLNLATDGRSDKKFLLTSKLCPMGAVCPLLGATIYMY